MERLWSPWRFAYVTRASTTPGCVFCEAASGEQEHILARGQHAYVILNLYPYNPGHLMVVPNRHLGTLAEASADELRELMSLTRDAEVALNEAYQPQGINVGINLGRAAGAGIADHLHIHLVPRWTGDTNFISVIGETRVMPETLEQTAAKLRPIFARLTANDDHR